jgi:hypothetical protein
MQRYVALLDILGFKDLINKNPHEKVMELFNNFRIYVQMSLAKEKTTFDARGRMVSDLSNSSINSNIISDSLIFWSNDNEIESFFELVECLHSLIYFCHNRPFIFLRGEITYGNFSYEHNGAIRGKNNTLIIHPIMLGKALVDAYEIERQLQIAGCIIDPKAIEAAKNANFKGFNESWEGLIKEQKIIEYSMPLKNGSLKSWTINWVSRASNPDKETIYNGFNSFSKTVKDQSTEEKRANTLAYYSYIKESIYIK